MITKIEDEVLVALFLISMILTSIVCSGCAGEIYIGTRRIDEVQQTQVMRDKSFLETLGFKAPKMFDEK